MDAKAYTGKTLTRTGKMTNTSSPRTKPTTSPRTKPKKPRAETTPL